MHIFYHFSATCTVFEHGAGFLSLHGSIFTNILLVLFVHYLNVLFFLVDVIYNQEISLSFWKMQKYAN